MAKSLHYTFDSCKRAVQRLQEATALPMNEAIILDGTIHRFELAYETMWKLMKLYMEHKGIHEADTRSLFKEAVTLGLIEKGEDWLSIMTDRNAASYAYDEEMARLLCTRIQVKHIQTFQVLLLQMQAKLGKE